ncbi:hypothetical protein AGDE_13010 [Angomonas deanei]|uniref:Uncharacterized protein n=1 Tax=Angomonas deanei TaxID=59799 RepID=A0A7G2CC39_9TRYP|nr:hypothetical protein AGDE_13010 [Angomonas deanei]CAD2216591.1 hypothetical protein, conserved [Angomonas deanei]|eukprot:EPY23165.1 hypothetical protein AGDE_13010 [Angomonas deanei]
MEAGEISWASFLLTDMFSTVLTYWWVVLTLLVVVIAVVAEMIQKYNIYCDKRRVKRVQQECHLKRHIFNILRCHHSPETTTTTEESRPVVEEKGTPATPPTRQSGEGVPKSVGTSPILPGQGQPNPSFSAFTNESITSTDESVSANSSHNNYHSFIPKYSEEQMREMELKREEHKQQCLEAKRALEKVNKFKTMAQ